MAFRIVAIGEVLWDLLPSGKQLGGAPANVALHALALGADARLVSRVGNDLLGQQVLDHFRQQGLSIDTISIDPERPTGTVAVELGPQGEPHFTIAEGVAWDHLQSNATTVETMRAADAVCFGTLAQRDASARGAIHTLLAAAPTGAIRVCDINLRPPFVERDVIEHSLKLATVLKINEQELQTLARLCDLSGDSRAQITALAHQHGLSVVALTRGAEGSLLLADGQWSDQRGVSVTVRDSIGAGDAFTAALTVGLLAGWPLDTINERANQLAAYVCTQEGATPVLPASVRERFFAGAPQVGVTLPTRPQ